MLAANNASVSKQRPGGANGKMGAISNMSWAIVGGILSENWWLDRPGMAVFSASRFPGRNVIIDGGEKRNAYLADWSPPPIRVIRRNGAQSEYWCS